MGTQPTNAGIDFQQRVSAWALINMLAEIDLSNTMDIGDEIYIKKVAFESEDIIDDLVIHTKKNESIYLQMKRTASLTIQNEKSDFYKAINQFVQTYVLNSTENASYVLVTSSKSSTPIKDELRKILNSVRYNPLTFINNPLTKNEKSSFEKFKTMVEQIYYKLSNKNMGDNDFLNFISKVYIVVIDIEDGMSFEKVVLLTLENKFKVSNPKLFWSFAIKNALSFASQRLSVKKDELQHKWATHLNTYSNEDSKDKDDSFFEFEIQDSLAVGKDVILAELCEGVEWENEDLDLKNALFLIEFFRFDDNGNKKDLYKLPDLYFVSDDLKFKIIYRAATNKGMERYLLSNPHFKNKELVIMPANEIEQVEKDDHVIMYREKCLTILNANSTLTCLHCGKGISNNNCSMIEIDYIPSKLKLGIIHNECRQPLDRVLGMVSSKLFDEFSFLNNFDFDRWIKVLPNSQILSQSTDTMNDGKIKIVNWQPCNIPNSFSNFCVKMNLKNGDFHYTKVRGRVDRLNKSEADKIVKMFNENIEKLRDSDPIGYTSKNRIFGPYSELITLKENDEEILECVSAETVAFNQHIAEQHDEFENYYAPLCLLTNVTDGSIFEINRFPILISNPLNLKYFIENWISAGFEIKDYEVNILANDIEFDKFMLDATSEYKQIIIDPIYDKSQELKKGIVVSHISLLEIGEL